MIDAIKSDLEKRFGDPEGRTMWIDIAYTKDVEPALELKRELEEIFPACKGEIIVNPLSLSVSCHIGPGALAITCAKKLHV